MRILLSLFAAGFAGLALAQDLTDSDLAQQILEDLERSNENAEATNSLGQLQPRDYAQLRFLDRLNGSVEVFELGKGNSTKLKTLNITLDSCFVPADDGASDAVAFLDIQDEREDEPGFKGWMIASSPALNALEHPRYDVWVISCTNETKTQLSENPNLPPNRPIFDDEEFPDLENN